MIELVIRDYLDGLKNERDLDEPFDYLLGAMGYTDVYYTHGRIELGRDFIARKHAEGSESQYSFQIKRGNVGISEWRNDVHGQILQAQTTPIQHPGFDPSLPHQVILVVTGSLSEAVNLSLTAYNRQMAEIFSFPPVLVWNQADLVRYFAEKGVTGLYSVTAGELSSYAQYFELYSASLDQTLHLQRIEEFTRRWINANWSSPTWKLWTSLECETLGRACQTSSMEYECIYLHLCRIRALVAKFYGEGDEDDFNESLQKSLPTLLTLMERYCDRFWTAFSVAGDLCNSDISPSGFVAYPVHCSRFVEIASLLYLLTNDETTKRETSERLCTFLSVERGAAHPISDRYAVPLAMVSNVLVQTNRCDIASRLLNNCAVWLCDRYEHDLGIASVDADPTEEVETLLGSRFESIELDRRNTNFCAGLLLHLALYIGDNALFETLLNDFEAVRVSPEYYCVPDSIAACRIDSDDIRYIPSITFRTDSETDSFVADHHSLEPTDYRFAPVSDLPISHILSSVLRDRYFPSMWS